MSDDYDSRYYIVYCTVYTLTHQRMQHEASHRAPHTSARSIFIVIVAGTDSIGSGKIVCVIQDS